MKPVSPEFLDEMFFDTDVWFIEPRDRFDTAIVGAVGRVNLGPVLCYDVERVIGVLVEDVMGRVEAEEWFSFNIACAWYGDGTPVFLVRGE